MCVRIAIDLNIFEILAQAKGTDVTAAEIAFQANADPKLVVRIMRVLTASGYGVEKGAELYIGNATSDAMVETGMVASFRLAFDQTTLVANAAPGFFRETGHRNVEDATRTPFKHTYQTTLEYFPWLGTQPAALDDFANWMSSKDKISRGWLDWFPVEKHVMLGATTNSSDDKVLIVDVGGGKGHDLKRFKDRFTDTRGRLILQDLPAMVPQVSPEQAFEIVPHDFFTPQPVKGARVYYLNTVLHDWPDSRCREILEHLKHAMTKGYSKIIINEAILPEQGASLGHAARDMGMLLMLGAYERTERHWRELVESVGLTVVGVFYDPVPGNGVIVAEI
ncbi:hypothetical protein PSPO01_15151 [Paraphaeosphaeria sporulosa]